MKSMETTTYKKKKSMETTNHLHLHFNIARVVYDGFMYICDVAMELWGMVLCLLLESVVHA